MRTRLIHRTAASPHRMIAECLEGLFVSELMHPGKRLLVASPWMSDFPALDNRGGQFTALESSWIAKMIPFSSVVRALMLRNVRIRLACGPGARETDVIDRIETAARVDGTDTYLHASRLPHEHRLFSHEKALIADTWAVYGSMNFTYSGVELNGELITVTTVPDSVAKVATELLSLFE